MYLIRRWDNVTLGRSMELDRSRILAQDLSAERQTQVDVIESWDDRPEIKRASYFNGSEI